MSEPAATKAHLAGLFFLLWESPGAQKRRGGAHARDGFSPMHSNEVALRTDSQLPLQFQLASLESRLPWWPQNWEELWREHWQQEQAL